MVALCTCTPHVDAPGTYICVILGVENDCAHARMDAHFLFSPALIISPENFVSASWKVGRGLGVEDCWHEQRKSFKMVISNCSQFPGNQHGLLVSLEAQSFNVCQLRLLLKSR